MPPEHDSKWGASIFDAPARIMQGIAEMGGHLAKEVEAVERVLSMGGSENCKTSHSVVRFRDGTRDAIYIIKCNEDWMWGYAQEERESIERLE